MRSFDWSERHVVAILPAFYRDLLAAMIYRCTHCAYTARERHLIRRHTREKHTSTARIYPCLWPGCLWVFKRADHLTRHQHAPYIRHVMPEQAELARRTQHRPAELGKRKRPVHESDDDDSVSDAPLHRPRQGTSDKCCRGCGLAYPAIEVHQTHEQVHRCVHQLTRGD